MLKVMLVMDMPDSCYDCSLFGNHYSDLCCRALNNRSINYPYPKDFRQKWCPLKTMPQKDTKSYFPDEYQDGYKDGYNACIDEILRK